MLSFPRKTIDYIKNLLTKQQKQIEKSIKEVEKTDPVKSESLIETSEPGTDSYIADTHSKAVVLGEQLKKGSNNIRVALSKIGKGVYGKCEKCKKQIEIGRLLAMPTAQYCLSCSKKNSK